MLALLILLVNLSYAQVTEVIEEANKKVHQTIGPSEPCSSCAPRAGTEVMPALPAWQQCVTALCPFGTETDDSLNIGALTAAYQAPEIVEVGKLAHQALLMEMNSDRDSMKFFLAEVEKNGSIDDPKAKLAASVFRVGKKIGEASLDNDGELDIAKSREAFLKAGGSAQDFPVFVEVAKEIIKDEEKDNQTFSEFTENKSPEEIKRQALIMLDQLDKTAKQAAESLGLPDKVINDPSIRLGIRNKIESGEFSELNYDYIKEENADRLRTARILNSEKIAKLISTQPLSMREAVSSEKESEMRLNLKAMDMYHNGEKFGDLPYGKLINLRYSDCISAAAIGYLHSPTPQQIRDFEKREKQLRSEFFKGTQRILSKKSAQALAETGAQWKFKRPLDRQRFLLDFKERLIQEAKSDFVNAEDFEKMDAKQRQRAVVIMSNSTDDDYFDGLKETCKEKMSTDNDQALLMKDTFVLSGRTVVTGKWAKTIAFHEYAHMASTFISKSGKSSTETRRWYADSRQCLDEQRGEKKKFTEEDFASMVSGALSLDVNDHQCMGTLADPANERYFTLADPDYDKLHSGPLYLLLLRNSTAGRPTPAVCVEALKMKGEKDKIPGNCSQPEKSAESNSTRARN